MPDASLPDPEYRDVRWEYTDEVFWVVYQGVRSPAQYWQPTPDRVTLWEILLHAAERKVA